jgi:hypothetical protein
METKAMLSQGQIAQQCDLEAMNEFDTLLSKTNTKKPAKGDVAAFRQLLRQHPELWAVVGNLAEQAAYQLIESTLGTPALKESLKAGYEQLQREMGADNAPMLEQLLIQQVVLSWLRLNIIEYKYTAVTSESIPLTRADYWERRLSAAQRRFLRACATLGSIRKMNLSPVQVNIAQQQVNQVKV